MKRVWATLLTLVMMLSLAAPAGAAEKATATTMRLMETEGTASVENAAGKTLTMTKNMRLYNGYEVSTEAASYAYVSLDSSKAVKLDASSAAEVSKSGRQLELKLTDGKLFFNVPVALEQDESMEIRTSTMMMGVRGTSGWVSVLDRYTTRIGILEGMVTIYSQDPITGADRSVTITGGQTATIIRHERAQAMEQELIRQGVIIEANIVEELTELGQVVEELREDGVPGFAAAEVAKDSDLQDRINKESPLDADLIAQNAAQKLAADEAAAALKEAQQEAAQQPQDDTTPASTKNLFAETKTVVVTETVVVTDIRTETEYLSSILDNPENQQVKDALKQFSTVAVTNANLDLSSIGVDAGKTLYILSGELSNSGTANVNGTLNIMEPASMTNTGSLSINSANSLHVYGRLTNSGTLTIPGKVVVESSGMMTNNGTIVLSSGTFKVVGEYEDNVNEVMKQDEDGVVEYLGDFADAIASGMTNLKVLDAGTVTANGILDENVTLDMNGNAAWLRTLYWQQENDADMVPEWAVTGKLTLMDSVGGGMLHNSISVEPIGELTIKSGTIVAQNEPTISNLGKLTINGGEIITLGACGVYNGIYDEAPGGGYILAELTMNGGTITNYVPQSQGDDDDDDDGCALYLDSPSFYDVHGAVIDVITLRAGVLRGNSKRSLIGVNEELYEMYFGGEHGLNCQVYEKDGFGDWQWPIMSEGGKAKIDFAHNGLYWPSWA